MVRHAGQNAVVFQVLRHLVVERLLLWENTAPVHSFECSLSTLYLFPTCSFAQGFHPGCVAVKIVEYHLVFLPRLDVWGGFPVWSVYTVSLVS